MSVVGAKSAGHAYTPGLKISRRVVHRARRVLPIAGKVLVAQGDVVAARQIVAETAMPGDVIPVNLANALSMPPADAEIWRASPPVPDEDRTRLESVAPVTEMVRS